MDKIKKLLCLGMFGIIMFVSTSCSILEQIMPSKELTPEDLVNKTIEELIIPEKINRGLDLPEDIDGVKITWNSEDDIIYENEKSIFVNLGENYSFKLYGIFLYQDIEITKEYNITVANGQNGKADYAWDFFKKKIPSTTASNLDLYDSDEVYNGFYPTYKSLNEDVLASDGTLYQTMEDHDVVLNTYLQNDKTIMIYPSNVKVLAFTHNQRVNMTIDWLKQEVENVNINSGTKYPEIYEVYDVDISWFSKEFGLISANGSIVHPLTQKDVVIGCSVVSGDISKTLTFEFKNFGGDITDMERLKLWSEGSIQTSLKGTKNYVDSKDNLIEQVRTNSYGALNLATGEPIEIDKTYYIDTNDPNIVTKYYGSSSLNTDTHPAVPQSKLDELFYPGYKMPNEQNILWIVVHESGMPRETQNAECLAQIQWRNAYGSGRQASWHYQVDEGKIYQSFDDSIVCWHASDGTGLLGGGNNNGIGIEMCINSDGNYDGAMMMDAKLIAYLMHKYNLTLDNVKRHYDFAPDKKVCPNYMMRTNRWEEFLGLINREYMAYDYYQKGARFEWSVTTEDGKDALTTYFNPLSKNVYANKPVNTEVILTVSLTVTYNNETSTFSKKIKLLPPGEKDE